MLPRNQPQKKRRSKRRIVSWMLVVDYIIYVFYKLACLDPFWNTWPRMGSSFFLTIPISYLVIRLLDVFGILNTFFVLTCFVPIWIMLYCLVSLRFEKACKRFKNKKIVTDWPTCMFFYIVFNVTMILLI